MIIGFMKEGFLNFFIASLVTGSVFGMSGALLKNAAMRYLPVILGASRWRCSASVWWAP